MELFDFLPESFLGGSPFVITDEMLWIALGAVTLLFVGSALVIVYHLREYSIVPLGRIAAESIYLVVSVALVASMLLGILIF